LFNHCDISNFNDKFYNLNNNINWNKKISGW
jgi:hypothetical protein